MIEKKGKSLHKKKEGLSPGTILYVGDTETEATHISYLLYDEGGCSRPPEMPEPKGHPGKRCWIGISGLSDTERIVDIGMRYGLSPLSLEDTFSTDEHPKIEFFDTYFYCSLRILDVEEKPEEQLSLFVGEDWTITICEHESSIFDPIIRRLERPEGTLRSRPSEYLAQAILDRIVDQYLVRSDELDARTKDLEKLVLEHPEETGAPIIHKLKLAILHLKRISFPLREQFSLLTKGKSPLIEEKALPLFRDTLDHTLWLSEECDMLTETIQGLMEVYQSSLDLKTNRIMNVLTIISTIFIPITFLTGLYGMNFSFMPAITQTRWGFFGITILCIVLALTMMWWFKRRKWW